MINDGEKIHLECTYIVPGLYRDIYHTRPEWTHEHPFIEYKNKKSPFLKNIQTWNQINTYAPARNPALLHTLEPITGHSSGTWQHFT